jgi:hypothetical protein
MDSVVYLLRSPLEVIPASLYSKAVETTVVIEVGKAPLPGRVVKSVPGCSQERGATLSYRELLEVLLANQRVITL